VKRAVEQARRLVGSPAAEALVEHVVSAPSRAHAVAEVNDRLLDVDRELRAGAAIPRSAARIALGTGALVGIIQVARTLGGPDPMIGSALLAFGGGVIAAVICWNFGRLADSRVRALRDAWNDLTRALLRLAPAGNAEAPGEGGSAAPGSVGKQEA